VPHPKIVEGYLRNLVAVLEPDTARSREILMKHMPPLIMTPEPKAYRITGAFDLIASLGEDGALKPDAADDVSPVAGYAKRSVGGTAYLPDRRP